MGLHLGEGRLRHGRGRGEPEDYVGIDVNYAARIAAAGNGGQIVLSQALVDALGGRRAAIDGAATGVALADEGLRAVKDFEEPRRLHRLVVPGAADDAAAAPDARAAVEPARATSRSSSVAADEIETLRRPPGVDPDPDPDRPRRQRQDAARARGRRRPCATDSRTGRGSSTSRRSATPALLEPTMASTLGRARTRRSDGRPTRCASTSAIATALLLLDNLEQLLPDRRRRRGLDRPRRAGRAAPGHEPRAAADLRRARPPGAAARPRRGRRAVHGSRDRAPARTWSSSDEARGVDPADLRAAVRAAAGDRARRGARPAAQPGADPRAARVTASTSPAARATCRSGSARFAARSPGATTCCPSRSAGSSGASPSSPAAGPPSSRCPSSIRTATSGSTFSRASSRSPTRASSGSRRPDTGARRRRRAALRPPPAPARIRPRAPRRGGRAGRRRGPPRRGDRRARPRTLGPKILGPAGQASHPPPRPRAAQRPRRDRLGAPRPATPTSASGSSAPIWRWFQQRGLLREGRELLGRLLVTPPSDAPAAHRRPRRRRQPRLLGRRLRGVGRRLRASASRSPSRLGDPVQRAEAHYDLGLHVMVASDPDALRDHEAKALELFTAAGDATAIPKARQALVLGVFLDRRLRGRAGARGPEPRRVPRRRGRVPGRRQHDLPRRRLPQVRRPRGVWKYVREGLALVRRERQPVRDRPRPRDGRDRPLTCMATPSSGRGRRARPTGSSRRRA